MDKIDKLRFTNLIFSECTSWSLESNLGKHNPNYVLSQMYYIKMRECKVECSSALG